jgi:twitching motility protein PilI
MQEAVALKSLRDRPFELLAELERRGRAVTASAATDSEKVGEWVGVALRMAGELYLVAREEAREVLGVPAQLTRVPGAKSWILGLANARASRVIVVNHRDMPAGLVVDEVLGFRRFADAEFTADVPPTIVRCERYIAGSFRRGNEQWPVLGLRALVEDPSFSEASA